MGVRDQLVQVFLNLILNAIDATDTGGRILVRAELMDERLVLHVEDIWVPDREQAAFSCPAEHGRVRREPRDAVRLEERDVHLDAGLVGRDEVEDREPEEPKRLRRRALGGGRPPLCRDARGDGFRCAQSRS